MANEIKTAFDAVFADGSSTSPYMPPKPDIRNIVGGTIQDQFDRALSLAAVSTQWKAPVLAASTADVAIATGMENGDALDGVTLATGDRVLLKNQAVASQNGIYVVPASGSALRAADANEETEIVGMACFVRAGIANGGKQFICTTPAPIVTGTTSLTFQEISDQSDLNATLAEKADEVPFADLLRQSRENLLPAATSEGMMDDYWQTVLLGAADGSVTAGIDRDGVLRVAAMLETTGVPALLDDYLWSVVTENGDLVFGYHFELGWVDSFGAVDVQIFDRLVATISRVYALSNGTDVTPITFGENNASAVGVVGTEARYVEDVAGVLTAKIEDVTARTSLLSSVSGLIYHVLYGQSLSDGSSSTPPVSTTAVRPGRAVMFNVGPAVRGTLNADQPTPAENRLSLVDLKESSRETPASQLGYELTKVGGIAVDEAALVVAHGRGGTPYSGLRKGTQPYANIITSIRRARIMAGLNGLDFAASTVSFIHGENNLSDSVATYKGYLEELQTDLTVDISVYTGAAGVVLLFVDQISNWTAYGAMPATSDVPLAQLQAALDNPGIILCVGPKYFLETVADGVHLTAASSARLGAYHGRAIRQTLAGAPWVPLHIASAVRTGANIVLTYAGGDGATDISIDTTLVSNPGNNGFEWFQTGGVPRTISSVTKTGTRQITVALSGDPGSPSSQQIGYARTGMSGTNGGPITGVRGNVRDNSADTTAYGAPMHNWACHQLVTI
ncbi:hypothetical protein IB277_07185 [Ensifer sp. ENS07]|uniref:hypothetical protein n=1 Tax=Ensifer sp. ENS07 TaxID=2769274 RepID=UPI001785EF58|nr:hypothetical protein [Ensifer sp. ENS07]MBD9636076.1 hypothetical protein [Ensifer sp. ENS07]